MGRKLGQHFLINKTAIRKIVACLELHNDDCIIEIGPGHGELTRELGSKNKELTHSTRFAEASARRAGSGSILRLCSGLRIIAIEKDPGLASTLASKFQIPITNFQKNFKLKIPHSKHLIVGDALMVLPRVITDNLPPTTHYKVVGNIPYYITGKLLRILGSLEHKPERVVFTLQKEVAERICARPPRMNVLAASVGFWAEPKIAAYISRKDFRPQPEVDGAIIHLRIKEEELRIKEGYYALIKILFRQPRKTIFNNLRATKIGASLLQREAFLSSGIRPSLRPGVLTVDDIKTLARIMLQ